MATHAVVVDSSARQTTVPVSPGTALSDVLHRVCTTRGLNPENYELKYNRKAIDLSLTWRLSNLPRGAKLDLVQGSRSPSVVTVALQLPENIRLTNKFASTTSLWQILRFFEDKGDASRRLNLTQKEVTSRNMASGSGRLYYSQPVLNFMGREFGTFLDLQKTLQQLGFGGGKGNVLLRLSFRESETPLEEAMEQIGQYFKSMEPAQTAASEAHGDLPTEVGDSGSVLHQESSDRPSSQHRNIDARASHEPSAVEGTTGTPGSGATQASVKPADAPSLPSDVSPETVNSIDTANRPTTVFLAPASTTPQAARRGHSESDYEPTVEHAKLHQARLNQESRNKRLASDRELAEQETARANKLAAVSVLDVRIRLPDQVTVQTVIGQDDTGSSLYTYIRSLLAQPKIPFILRYVGANGRYTDVHDSDMIRLIQGLGFSGRMALVMAWAPGAKVGSGPVLKEKVAEHAQAMKLPEPRDDVVPNSMPTSPGKNDDGQGKGKISGVEKENKLKGLLMKGFSRK